MAQPNCAASRSSAHARCCRGSCRLDLIERHSPAGSGGRVTRRCHDYRAVRALVPGIAANDASGEARHLLHAYQTPYSPSIQPTCRANDCDSDVRSCARDGDARREHADIDDLPRRARQLRGDGAVRARGAPKTGAAVRSQKLVRSQKPMSFPARPGAVPRRRSPRRCWVAWGTSARCPTGQHSPAA